MVSEASAAGTPACKEWAVVVRALLAGEQIVDLRKGGIREDGRHFSLHATRFWLYPPVEHQQADLLKPAYARWVADDPAGPEAGVRIAGWADAVGAATVSEPEVLDALDGKVIWARSYVESRFRWKRRDPLHVLALRVHRLATPITVPYRDEYGGCTSWVDVAGLPADPTTLDSTPVLSDGAFAARLKGVAAAIPGGLSSP
jgi:hypothetical protein